MDAVSILKEIAIPLVSALLGGLLSLWGVKITLSEQSKRDEANRKAAVKPWFFIWRKTALADQSASFIAPATDISSVHHLSLFIKNMDHAILILDRIESEKVCYFPQGDIVIDKNSVAELDIYMKNHVENFRDFKLYIKDIYGNCYRHELKFDGKQFTLGESKEV